jgi:hypothetical protein
MLPAPKDPARNMSSKPKCSMPTASALSATLLACLAALTPATAQWLDYPTPGIPRLEDGSPDLDAPTPRTVEGKPDFSGMWFSNVPSVEFCRGEDCISEERMAMEQVNVGRNLEGGLPYTEWSKEVMVERGRDGGRYDPHTYCMPPNYPRAWTLPQYQKIVQTRDLMVMLHEFNAAYRQVFIDGRPLEDDPNPTWNGHSTAHWEGDTLVMLTNGIRDDMWLDIQGSPVTETALVTERLTRQNFGHLEIELTVDDPTAYTEPWTVTLEHLVQVDTAMLEEICIDYERDVALYETP